MEGREPSVVVVGGGAAGLAAALAASETAPTVILEASDRIGGATLEGSGLLWVPNHHRMIARGYADSRAEALAYLDATRSHEGHADAFIDRVCDVVRTIEQASRLTFHPAEEPDAQPSLPGAKSGRHLRPGRISLRRLGEWRRFVEPVRTQTRWQRLSARASGGRALVASLLEACLRAGVGLRPQTRALEILFEGPHPAGVQVRADRSDGGTADFALHGPVIIASGRASPGSRWSEHLRSLAQGAPALPTDPRGRWQVAARACTDTFPGPIWAAGEVAAWSLEPHQVARGAPLAAAMTAGFICGLEASRTIPAR